MSDKADQAAQAEQADQLQALVNKAIQHVEAGEKEQAGQCIDAIFAVDPDNLDAHLLAARLRAPMIEEAIEHVKFVLDRDIKYAGPLGYYDKFVDRFLVGLNLMRLNKKHAKGDYLAVSTTIVDYSIRLLEAGRAIGSLDDFAAALTDLERYDDVIQLGLWTNKAVDPDAIGWPGLKMTHDYYGPDEILEHVLKAYFATGRYDEACAWIYARVKKNPDDWYLWRWLGETLCWVGYPEETARAWIIAVRKVKSADDLQDDFDRLADLVYNPAAPMLQNLSMRLHVVKDQIPPEKQQAYDDLVKAVNGSGFRSTKVDPPSVDYIERKLGIKLPPYQSHRELWLAKSKSKHPVIQEILATLDEVAATFVEECAKLVESTPAVTRERQKVAVGADAAPNTSQQDLALHQFGIDVTEQARRGEMPPIVGRDREIERMVRILARQEKNNPILLGEAGVGKTAIVHGLAQRIASGAVPPVLKDRRVIELNVGVLVAGTTFRGDFERRINNVVKASREDPQIILFIDELHTLIGAGSGGQAFDLDASNILKPALANGELRLIGATTAQEFSRTIEKDAALERRFSPIWINEVDRQMTLAVVQARRERWENHHGIRIGDELLRAAVQLADEHVRHRRFPDKAIDVIDEACALVRTEAASAGAGADGDDDASEPLTLTQDHLQRVVDQWTGSAAAKEADEDQTSGGYVEEIEEKLRRHVVGHEKVLRRLSTIVAAHKLGLRVSRLPRVLLFVGQARSGKTETARALAQVLWPDEKERLLFIDMPMYADPSHLSRLIGVPPGYAGGDQTGLLSLHLRHRPHSVVYLHNFHAAHPHVLRLFATLFSEGSAPDARGQSMFAAGTIFVLSAAVDDEASPMGFGAGPSEASDERDMSDFLDRLDLPDEILDVAEDRFWFGELNEKQTRDLFRRQLDKIVQRPQFRNSGIQFGDDVLQRLVAAYRKQHPSVRNLKSLLNQIAFPRIRTLATDEQASGDDVAK